MRGFLLPRITGMGRERVIEGLAVDVLRVVRKVSANCRWQLDIVTIRHRFCSRIEPANSMRLAVTLRRRLSVCATGAIPSTRAGA